jgi:hypothetical protein
MKVGAAVAHRGPTPAGYRLLGGLQVRNRLAVAVVGQGRAKRTAPSDAESSSYSYPEHDLSDVPLYQLREGRVDVDGMTSDHDHSERVRGKGREHQVRGGVAAEITSSHRS